MKFSLIFFIIILLQLTMQAQVTPYKVIPDPKHPEVKMLVGNITKYAIANDSTMLWYALNFKSYYSKQELLNKVFAAKDVKYIVFGGTWCEDTQIILPGFFKLLSDSHISDDAVTFYGVDREKKTLGNLAAAFNITNVPTIIAMKNGKEIGRVVEYGSTGKWDEELANIIIK